MRFLQALGIIVSGWKKEDRFDLTQVVSEQSFALVLSLLFISV